VIGPVPVGLLCQQCLHHGEEGTHILRPGLATDTVDDGAVDVGDHLLDSCLQRDPHYLLEVLKIDAAGGLQPEAVCWSLTAAEERARWFSDALEHARRAASEDPEACVVLCRERDEARARLVEVECERKETMAKLAKVERNVAREPCEACAKKEATIEALNDWLTDTIIAHEPCEACAKKEES
jgi:hypothetical protein